MNNLEKNKYWIWFSMIPKLGIKRKQELLKQFKTPDKLYDMDKEKLIKIRGIGEEIANNIINSKKEDVIKKHIKYMIENEIDIINIYDNDYPENLKKIYDPPISIFIKGNKKILNKENIGIIGCRECSEYGKNMSKYFSYKLAKEKINIVSGLAKGVDSYAHIGSLIAKENCGKTIAVVGNGLDIVYPKENTKLVYEIIRSGGAIISEYPCGTKPNKMNFPARNRIISGISNGIIVIEAKERSGTLITVDFALEQGKEVYVVPGNINSINSIGTNELIKQGARVVTTIEDIEI